MEIVRQYCSFCRFEKEFWLKNTREPGFYCKCGVNRIMHNYYGAEYIDYFSGMIRDPITVEGLMQLATEEHMVIDPDQLRNKLQKYDLANLTEQEFFDMLRDVVRSDSVFRFRTELMQFTDAEQMLRAIAKLNSRIDIPGLRRYLDQLKLPLGERQVIQMEQAIEREYYNPEIDVFTEW